MSRRWSRSATRANGPLPDDVDNAGEWHSRDLLADRSGLQPLESTRVKERSAEAEVYRLA